MLLNSAKPMIEAAKRGRFAVPAMNTNGGNYEISRAILETAAEEHAPVILQSYETNCALRGFDYVGHILRFLAERTPVPVVIHLDHGKSFEAAVKATRAGFTSLMVDYSGLPLKENIIMTKQVVTMARACSLSIEAEVGEMGTTEQLAAAVASGKKPAYTNPDDVKAFTSEVDIDILAVSIGNAHGFYHGEPIIDVELLRRCVAASRVPLVLHGATGIPHDVVRECVEAGVVKVNVGTLLRTNHIKYFVEGSEKIDHKGHPWRIQQVVIERLKEDIRPIIRLLEASGKANQV